MHCLQQGLGGSFGATNPMEGARRVEGYLPFMQRCSAAQRPEAGAVEDACRVLPSRAPPQFPLREWYVGRCTSSFYNLSVVAGLEQGWTNRSNQGNYFSCCRSSRRARKLQHGGHGYGSCVGLDQTL
jgi:hypothetical protein